MLGFDAYLIEIYIHEFFRLDLDDEGNLLTSSMLLHPLPPSYTQLCALGGLWHYTSSILV